MKYVYKLNNLCCASCAAKIEIAVNKIEGVVSAKVIFMTQRLTFEADEADSGRIEPMIEKAVKRIEPDVKLRRE
ncbi:MAG: cation transporter [Methanomassiliicoccaceae archaeon]|nr:cation transporter [Methanomassiliicoccaceae archaeon]